MDHRTSASSVALDYEPKKVKPRNYIPSRRSLLGPTQSTPASMQEIEVQEWKSRSINSIKIISFRFDGPDIEREPLIR